MRPSKYTCKKKRASSSPGTKSPSQTENVLPPLVRHCMIDNPPSLVQNILRVGVHFFFRTALICLHRTDHQSHLLNFTHLALPPPLSSLSNLSSPLALALDLLLSSFVLNNNYPSATTIIHTDKNSANPYVMRAISRKQQYDIEDTTR